MLSRLLKHTSRVVSKVNNSHRSLSLVLFRRNQSQATADLQTTEIGRDVSIEAMANYHDMYKLIKSVRSYGTVIGNVANLKKPSPFIEEERETEKCKKNEDEYTVVQKAIQNGMKSGAFAFDLGNIWDNGARLQIRPNSGKPVDLGYICASNLIEDIDTWKEHFSPAPYGNLKTMKTEVNKKVRSGLTIDYSKIQIESYHFDGSSAEYMASKFSELLERVQNDFEDDTLYLEPYNLNIYTEKGFFKSHVDTPRFPNMVGTLVVLLQEAKVGGKLIIRHGKEVFTEGSSGNTAFYCDREHEITPVMDGARVALTFNICKDNEAVAKTEQAITIKRKNPIKKERNYAAMIEAIKKSSFHKLGILTELRYSQKGILLKSLKGTDRDVYEVLSKEPSFKVELVPVIFHETYLNDPEDHHVLTAAGTVYRFTQEDIERMRKGAKTAYKDDIPFFLNAKGSEIYHYYCEGAEHNGNSALPECEENLYFNGAIVITQPDKPKKKVTYPF